MIEPEQETIEHIQRVQQLLNGAVQNLMDRGRVHDRSKLYEPEVSLFNKCTPRLKKLTYGSEGYLECLKELGPALKHHYQNNSHHPEHRKNGINGMSLLDILEMICDWKAASERHEDGDIWKSLEINQGRFGIGSQLQQILANTVRELFPPKPETWHCFGCGAGGCTFNFCYQCGAGRKDYDPTN